MIKQQHLEPTDGYLGLRLAGTMPDVAQEWRSIHGWRWQVLPVRPTSTRVPSDQTSNAPTPHHEQAFIIGHQARNATGWRREVIPIATNWPIFHANDIPLSIVMPLSSHPDEYRRRVQLLEQAAQNITTPWVLIADPPLSHSPQWLLHESGHLPAAHQITVAVNTTTSPYKRVSCYRLVVSHCHLPPSISNSGWQITRVSTCAITCKFTRSFGDIHN